MIIESLTFCGKEIPCHIETDGTWDPEVITVHYDSSGNIINGIVVDKNDETHEVNLSGENVYYETEDLEFENVVVTEGEPSKPWWWWINPSYWG